MILKSSQTTQREIAIGKERFFITNIIKGHKVTDLTKPNKLGTMMSKVATRSSGRTGSRNDYVLLVTTRQKTLNSKTLFSSKEGRSASKTDISSTAGQHRPGEARRHQSTQAQCDPRLDADLHRTVARRCGRNNPKLLDDGTHPTSQDFFHLPPRTT
jgi:hypothetical protein